MLLLHDRHDEKLRHDSDAHLLGELPNARLVTLEEPPEEPEEVNEALFTFLDEVTGTAGTDDRVRPCL